MQNSVNRQLGIASVNAYKPLALLCFIIEVQPRRSCAMSLHHQPFACHHFYAAGARHICSHLPPSVPRRFLAPARSLYPLQITPTPQVRHCSVFLSLQNTSSVFERDVRAIELLCSSPLRARTRAV
jgi:hypothetical protein